MKSSVSIITTSAEDGEIHLRRHYAPQKRRKTKSSRNLSFLCSETSRSTAAHLPVPKELAPQPVGTDSAHREQIRLLKHLTKAELYKTEGLFRVCGRATDVQNAEEVLNKEKLSQESLNTLWSQLGPHGCADLLKSMLRHRTTPLLSSECAEKIRISRTLKCSGSDKPHSSSELVSLYLNSVFSLVPRREAKLLRAILDFLRLVIASEDQSRMGVQNLASIFSGLLFAAPMATEQQALLQEFQKQTDLLNFVLQMYQCHHDLFTSASSSMQSMTAIETIKQKPLAILRGEEVTCFYRSDDYVYVQASVNVFQLSWNTVQTSLTHKSDAMMHRSQVPTRSKRRQRSEPSVIQSARRHSTNLLRLPRGQERRGSGSTLARQSTRVSEL